ncbi:hypothetical protein L1887_51379 [Cichorium endivia]|nr:hypothetical protein L1887_51379 [Cichorium endivia]
MLTLEPFSEDQGRSAVHPARGIPPISFLAPCGFTHPLTRTHVRLLGPCFKTGRMGCPQAGAGSTQTAPRGATGSGHDGALTLSGAPFQGTWARSAAEDASPDYNSDSEAVRFSSWADPGSLAVTKGILVHVHGSFCFAGFDNDPSAGSPTETLLRLLLPLNDKVQWNSRDVAGGEPPTQIAPPTKNGHAPPTHRIKERALSLSILTMSGPERRLAFEHSNFFKVTAPEARPGQLRPGAHRRQKGRAGITAAAGTRLALQWILVKDLDCTHSNYQTRFEPGIVIYCHYLPVSGLGNLRACCLPWMW